MAEDKKEPTQEMEGEAAAPAPKKKGKLPMIVMLAVLLGAGGFFGMKMRAPKEKKAPEIKLGETLKLKEFLVNLSDQKTYLRAEITLHLKEGVKIEEGGATEGGGPPEMDIIRNAILDVLKSKDARNLQTLDGTRQLRRDIAATINKALNGYDAEKKGESPPKTDEKASKEGTPTTAAAPPKHPDWDSDDGPVLKVYFTNFATQ